MDPERWRKIEDAFNHAADLTRTGRAAYLESISACDPALRREVEELLASGTEGLIGSAIQSTSDEIVLQAADDAMVGSRLGSYRIVALVGRGGMGAVYRAVRDDDEFRQVAAIKVVPRLLANDHAVARFRSERQILATLTHPNIARLLDGGTADGIPYLVMEFVEGVPLTDYASAHDLTLAQRLELMRSVCAAVQYAHQNLVIHRDLKPANILVMADGTVKLLDFGVAKLLDPEHSGLTQTSAMMLTPDYASPEQVNGEAVTTASDVYSLGVVLYELLAGVRPYRLSSSNPTELHRVVCLNDPPPPSQAPGLAARLRRQLIGDLDNIVSKALHKDPDRRYGSAEQLSADLQRHLDGLPVIARPDTLAYRAGKFARRNRWPLAIGALTAAVLLASTIIAVRQAREARHRFDQLRGFAHAVLVDLDAQLRDIPGTTQARQALIAEVDGFLKKSVAENSSDDAALAAEIATTYLRMGEMQGSSPGALASFETARKLMLDKIGEARFRASDRLLMARISERIGLIQMDLGRTSEAASSLSRMGALASNILLTDGGNTEALELKARAYWRLARLNRVQYNLQDAEQNAKASIAACEALLARGQRTKPVEETYYGVRMVLAGVLKRQGNWAQGLALYELLLAEAEAHARADPQSVAAQRELALIHQIVADMLNSMAARRAEVPAHVRASVQIAERLSALDPMDAALRGELGQYLSTAGEFLDAPAEYEESMADLRRSLATFEQLLRKEPGSGVYLLYAALVEADIGRKLAQHNSAAQGLVWLRRGRGRLAGLVARDPKNLTHTLELLKVERWLVEPLARLGRADESIALGKAGVVQARQLASNPKTPLIPRELPRSCQALADAYRILGRTADARAWYRQTLQAWEQLVQGRPPYPDESPEIEAARKWVRSF